MKCYKLIAVVLLAAIISCCTKPKAGNRVLKGDAQKKAREDHQEDADEVFLVAKELKYKGYTFKFGFTDYDEDKYGFSNPAFLRVIKNEKIIFEDSFKGQGDIYVEPLSVHSLSGNKIVFTLNWGTEACDYNQCSRYYIINDQGKINFLNEYCSISGGDGYASRTFQHIFPEDSAGVKNTLVIVERMLFHEHDQPDLSDTIRILFDGNSFQINKLTNNLEKAK